MSQYRVNVTPEGTLDFSGVAIGNKGRKDIQEMIETVWGWQDKTPLGIDALKRYLSDFYSDSAQARGFTARLVKKVTQTLEDQIPQYADMTRPYAETSKILNNIESNLLGKNGRLTADRTLRRLVSSMRDDATLRRDLVNTLMEQGGQDIPGLVAGHAMSTVFPRGLAGLGTASEAGLVAFRIFSPKFLPLIAASSPRVQGEFLRMYGKALKETTGLSLPVGKMSAYLALMGQTTERPEQTQK
jgi:hypothetical protein